MVSGKHILITGSSSGIGAAVARLAVEYGGRVYIHGRTMSEELKSVANEFSILPFAADVNDCLEVKKLVQDLLNATRGKIDVLINRVGIVNPKPFLECNDNDFVAEFASNVLGTIHFCQEVCPVMFRNGYGRIVNTASVRGHSEMASARGMAYSMSKASIINLTACLAKEFSPTIAVNAVSPGFIPTRMSKRWNEEVWKQAKSNLLGRVGTTHEIAEAVLFLASDRASFITGQTLIVDGGYCLAGK